MEKYTLENTRWKNTPRKKFLATNPWSSRPPVGKDSPRSNPFREVKSTGSKIETNQPAWYYKNKTFLTKNLTKTFVFQVVSEAGWHRTGGAWPRLEGPNLLAVRPLWPRGPTGEQDFLGIFYKKTEQIAHIRSGSIPSIPLQLPVW